MLLLVEEVILQLSDPLLFLVDQVLRVAPVVVEALQVLPRLLQYNLQRLVVDPRLLLLLVVDIVVLLALVLLLVSDFYLHFDLSDTRFELLFSLPSVKHLLLEPIFLDLHVLYLIGDLYRLLVLYSEDSIQLVQLLS